MHANYLRHILAAFSKASSWHGTCNILLNDNDEDAMHKITVAETLLACGLVSMLLALCTMQWCEWPVFAILGLLAFDRAWKAWKVMKPRPEADATLTPEWAAVHPPRNAKQADRMTGLLMGSNTRR